MKNIDNFSYFKKCLRDSPFSDETRELYNSVFSLYEYGIICAIVDKSVMSDAGLVQYDLLKKMSKNSEGLEQAYIDGMHVCSGISLELDDNSRVSSMDINIDLDL